MKIIGKVITGICALFLLWALFSWVDVVSDNCSPNPQHSDLNLFVLMTESTKEEEPTPAEGQCGDPLSVLRVDMASIEERSDTGVIFLTDDGNTWYAEPENMEDFSTDGYYVVMFDTMGTDTINDDQILKVFREIW